MSLSVAILKTFLFLITHVHICVQSVIWGSGQKRVWDLLKPVTETTIQTWVVETKLRTSVGAASVS